jgi:hydroxyacylglutathione hydrolase
MRVIIETFTLNELGTNCYVVAAKPNGPCAVIDPSGYDMNPVIEYVKKQKLTVTHIINTHWHGDHVIGNEAIREFSGAPIYIHELDAPYLPEAAKQLRLFLGIETNIPPADRLVREGDTIQVGELVFNVIHTPGHTVGGITLHVKGVLFTGDTLMAGTIGRTDFPGGSFSDIIRSIKDKLLLYPDDTVIYPGHGEPSTIGEEKMLNPFLHM